MKKPPQEDEGHGDEPTPTAKQKRNQHIAILVAGTVLGSVGTLGAQALLSAFKSKGRGA